MCRRRVHLRGAFAQFHDGPIEVEAATVWEAIEAVTRQLPGFQPDAVAGRKRVQVIGYSTIESLKTQNDDIDIHIMPALTFGKDGGLLQTVLGVVLVVASFVIPGLGAFAAQALFSMGASMVLGGIVQMLTPQPQLGANNEDEVRSKYLPSRGNTVKLGTTIGLGYGEAMVFGQIMSLNIDAVDTGL